MFEGNEGAAVGSGGRGREAGIKGGDEGRSLPEDAAAVASGSGVFGGDCAGRYGVEGDDSSGVCAFSEMG